MTNTIDTPIANLRRQFLRTAAFTIFIAAVIALLNCLVLLLIFRSEVILIYAAMVVIVGAGSALSLRLIRTQSLGLAVTPIAGSFVLTVIGSWIFIPGFYIVGALVLTIVVLLVSISGNRTVTLLISILCTLLAMVLIGFPQPILSSTANTSILDIAKVLSAGAVMLIIWLIADRYTNSQEIALSLIEQRAAEAETARSEAETARIESDTRRDELQKLLELVQTLELPVIPIGSNVLAAPLVGNLDSRRVNAIQRRLLDMVSNQRAHTVVLDITGISVVDTEVARALLNTAQAVRLLGARTYISGISANIAQTLVSLGVGFNNIHTVSDLGQALELAQRHEADGALDR